jgi:hypothetical protein
LPVALKYNSRQFIFINAQEKKVNIVSALGVEIKDDHEDRENPQGQV